MLMIMVATIITFWACVLIELFPEFQGIIMIGGIVVSGLAGIVVAEIT